MASSTASGSCQTARKRLYCRHCDEYVSRSTYFHHKHLYFDEDTQKWMRWTQPRQAMSDLVSFEFSPGDSPTRVNPHDPANRSEQGFDDDDIVYEFEFSSELEAESTDTEVEFEEVENNIELVYDSDEEEEEHNPVLNQLKDDAGSQKVIHAFLLFTFMWQSLFHISDSAIALLLSFVARFFSLASKCLKVEALGHLSRVFPSTLYRAKKFLGQLNEKFVRYVACPSCHCLYRFKDCIELAGSKKESRMCSFVRYPDHIQSRMRAPCGKQLLKTLRSPSGSEYLAPFRTYCYQSCISGLKELLNRSNNEQLCEEWRKTGIHNDRYCDVYDGMMWKHFQFDNNGVPFLAAKYNYLFMLNCDWFQPFKHTQFSVGVLYIAVENLPRQVRFKRENLIVVGLIPGPSEPTMTINTYLEPLIKDLMALWHGVTININGNCREVRAAVSCLACDVPAARKLGGFLSHNAKHGCSRCLKEFSVQRFGDYPDYSGFNRSEWETRSHALHVWYALKHKEAKTEEQRKKIEAIHGARYTSLYELPYYNAISSCVIDPMHCLFLGVAKRVFQVWLSNGIINENQLAGIQDKVDSFHCPPDIGRIPYKMASNASGLKADQWKNWALYFSLFALKGSLPHRDYNCWLIFVKLCHLICRREILKLDLLQIENYIQEFCIQFELLYGKKWLTPNMHLLGHITDCIRDHGPVYAFWLFAFERMNGLLGSFQTNNHDITVQLMRKFTSMQSVTFDQWPEDLKTEFSSLLCKSAEERGSLAETMCATSGHIKALPPVLEKALHDEELSKINSLMVSMYRNSHVSVIRLYRYTKAIVINDSIQLAAESSRYSHCSKVFIANCLVEINYFVQCTVLVTNPLNNQCSRHSHWLAHCSSYMEHQCKAWYGYPTQVWSIGFRTGFNYFLLNDVTSRVVYVRTKVNFGRIIGEDSVLVVVPIPLNH